MTTEKDKDPLDNVAIKEQTYREVLTAIMTDDWNTRKKVMHLREGDVLHINHTITAEIPAEHVRRLLKDLPPME